jgi:tetratricopeptide (TPR) repeat protein
MEKHCGVDRRWSRLIAAVLLWPIGAYAQASDASKAQALQQQGKLTEAAQAWQAVIEKNPADAGALASLGVIFSTEHKYPEAASAYRKAIALDPKLPGVQLNLGLAEFKQGHFQEAIAPLSAVLRAEPDNLQAQTLLGLSNYGAKHFVEAVTYLEPVAKSDPANSGLHELLAQSCLWAKQYACAQDEFRKILEQNPDSPAAHILLGEALDGLGRTSDAIAEFQQAAKASAPDPNLHFGLGYLYWKSRHYDEAKHEFETELTIDPNHAQSLAYLGDIEMKANNPDRALSLLRKAAGLKNDTRIAYLDLGVVLTQRKQYPDAITALQRAEELDSTEPDAHYRLAQVYKAIGNLPAARKEFARVSELHQKADEALVLKMPAAPSPLLQ